MYTLRNLFKFANENATEIGGKVVPARPLPDPWSWRMKDAWEVLMGRADAVKWPDDQ